MQETKTEKARDLDVGGSRRLCLLQVNMLEIDFRFA